MSEQDLAQALTALEADEIRAAVAAGDLSAVGELELTDEERELLVAAASGEPEVVGFGINTGLMGGLDPQAWKLQKVTPDVANRPKTSDKLQEAMLNYLKG